VFRSTEEREEDLTGGFVPHRPVHPDDLEEGEVHLEGVIAHDELTRQKRKHANFLRRNRKRKQVAAFNALNVKEKETAKLLQLPRRRRKRMASRASLRTRGGT